MELQDVNLRHGNVDPTIQPGYGYDQSHPPETGTASVYRQANVILNQNMPTSVQEPEIVGYCGCPIKVCVGILICSMILLMLGSLFGPIDQLGAFVIYNLIYIIVIVSLLYTFIAKEPLPNYVWPAKIYSICVMVILIFGYAFWVLFMLFLPEFVHELHDNALQVLKVDGIKPVREIPTGLLIGIGTILFSIPMSYGYIRYVHFDRYQRYLKQARARLLFGDNMYRVENE